jgi:prepilin-type N-terminal cleavage/methylation domain-containing protein
MKNKKFGFTLIELLVLIAILSILAGLILPFILRIKNGAGKTSSYNRTFVPSEFQVGDTVYIEGMDTTGKVNQVVFGSVEIMVKGTNGVPLLIHGINSRLIHKVPTTAER